MKFELSTYREKSRKDTFMSLNICFFFICLFNFHNFIIKKIFEEGFNLGITIRRFSRDNTFSDLPFLERYLRAVVEKKISNEVWLKQMNSSLSESNEQFRIQVANFFEFISFNISGKKESDKEMIYKAIFTFIFSILSIVERGMFFIDSKTNTMSLPEHNFFLYNDIKNLVELYKSYKETPSSKREFINQLGKVNCNGKKVINLSDFYHFIDVIRRKIVSEEAEEENIVKSELFLFLNRILCSGIHSDSCMNLITFLGHKEESLSGNESVIIDEEYLPRKEFAHLISFIESNYIQQFFNMKWLAFILLLLCFLSLYFFIFLIKYWFFLYKKEKRCFDEKNEIYQTEEEIEERRKIREIAKQEYTII